MKSFLAFLALVVIVVLGLGYYLDWFKVSSSGSDSTMNINTQIDKKKISEDVEHAKQKVQGTAKDLQEKIKPGTESTKDKNPPPPQNPPPSQSVP